MNEKHPLSAEQRAEIERVLKLKQGGHVLCDDLLRAALEAADYWREAVKDADICEFVGDICPFLACKAVAYEPLIVEHDAYCPFQLAQETK